MPTVFGYVDKTGYYTPVCESAFLVATGLYRWLCLSSADAHKKERKKHALAFVFFSQAICVGIYIFFFILLVPKIFDSLHPSISSWRGKHEYN